MIQQFCAALGARHDECTFNARHLFHTPPSTPPPPPPRDHRVSKWFLSSKEVSMPQDFHLQKEGDSRAFLIEDCFEN